MSRRAAIRGGGELRCPDGCAAATTIGPNRRANLSVSIHFGKRQRDGPIGTRCYRSPRRPRNFADQDLFYREE